MTTEALPTDLAQEVPPDYLQSRCPASARDSLLEAMQAEKARVTAELGNLTAERAKHGVSVIAIQETRAACAHGCVVG